MVGAIDCRATQLWTIARVKRRNDRPPYAVLVAPLPGGTGPGPPGAPPHAGALFLIHDPDVQFSDMSEAIATIFAMPMGAARLVAALAQGQQPMTTRALGIRRA